MTDEKQVAVIAPPRQKSVTIDMADRFGMEASAFETTLRSTVFPATGSAGEFAAFLLVCKQYDLNPLTKEIYAFPKQGGGIVPIVSIDGWLKLINSHPQFDGMEFSEQLDDNGDLVSCTCVIHRKDRKYPISLTEYFSECTRNTAPWKMKHRMLRHKAAIQCSRYSFGFAGIYEYDEAERMDDMRDVTPSKPLAERLAEAKTAPAASGFNHEGVHAELQGHIIAEEDECETGIALTQAINEVLAEDADLVVVDGKINPQFNTGSKEMDRALALDQEKLEAMGAFDPPPEEDLRSVIERNGSPPPIESMQPLESEVAKAPDDDAYKNMLLQIKRRGWSNAKAGSLRKAIPKEYLGEGKHELAQAWLAGWDVFSKKQETMP